MLNRWCTGELKGKLFRHYLKGLECIKYYGIAYDEPKRIDKNQGQNIQYPLYEWGITERQALQYCYDRGFDWEGLYKLLTSLQWRPTIIKRIGKFISLFP